MNNLDEDESCLSLSSSLVENEVGVINGKIKPGPLSDHCVRIKLEDSSEGSHHSLINQLGLISSAHNQQSFRRNSHFTLTGDFITYPKNNTNHSINNTNSNNNNSNNNNHHHLNSNNDNPENGNNATSNSGINQTNGKLSVQYISVSYSSTSGLSNCSTVTSSPTVTTLVSSSSPSSPLSSRLSSAYKNNETILHPSTIKLEPLDIGVEKGFNSITTTTVTTSANSSSSSSLNSPLKLESIGSITCENSNKGSSNLADCFISCPVGDDLEVNSSSVKSNLSLAHSHHSIHSHLHQHHSLSVTPNHHSNSSHHHHHHHHHHQRVLISPTDFLSLTEEHNSVVSAVRKDVNLSTSRLEIIKSANDSHGLTVSLDRYCESPFLIDSHREIHLISDDDASNTGRASRLSETHEEIPTEDLFAATLTDDQHNAIRETVITPIESDTNSCATPLTMLQVTTVNKNSSSQSPLTSPTACSSPSLSSSALSTDPSSSSSSLACATSLLTSSNAAEGLSKVSSVSSAQNVNSFDLTLVKEEKFEESENVEQMIVEEGTVDNVSSMVNEMVEDDVDDDVDLLNSESQSASTSTVTTFSVLNTLHNNSSIRLTPEESSSSLELRSNSLNDQMGTIPLQSSSSPSALMGQIPSFSHFGKQSTSSFTNGSGSSLVQITLPPTPTSSIATTPPTPTAVTSLTPTLSSSIIGPSSSSSSSPSSSCSSSSSSLPSSIPSTGAITVQTSLSSTLKSSSPASNGVNNKNANASSQNSVDLTSPPISSSSSLQTTSNPTSTASSSSSANLTLPLTPLDIKILPGGLLQFAANVAAVFPSSTILQKQLALQLLREDGTSIILPLTTRSGDSTSATIAAGFSANTGNSGANGLTLSTTSQTINANNKVSTAVSMLGNTGTLVAGAGGRPGSGIVVAGGLGVGPATGSTSANFTETLIPTLSTSQISLSNERLEQPQQQQQQIIGATKDSTSNAKLLPSENPGQNAEIDRPFKCELCNSTFTRLGNYTRHKKIHSLPSKEDQRFRCDICGKSFIQRCDLARHLHIHRGTEPHRCSQCGKGYIRHSDLVTHQRFHNKEKPFACPHCSKGFCQRGDLNRHLRSIHLQLKPILCSHCHKKFAKEETLLRHINANHRDTVVT